MALMTKESTTTPIIQSEVLHVLLTLSNFDAGVFAMLPFCPSLLEIFAISGAALVKTRVLKLLGIVCCHGQRAQSAVLNWLLVPSAAGCDEAQQDIRLGYLVTHFEQCDHEPEARVALVTFLNTLINTSTDPAHRLALRQGLIRSGFISLIERLQEAQQHHDTISHEPTALAMSLQAQILMKGHRNDLIRAEKLASVTDVRSTVDEIAAEGTISISQDTSRSNNNEGLYHDASQMEPHIEEHGQKPAIDVSASESVIASTNQETKAVEISSNQATTLEHVFHRFQSEVKNLDEATSRKLIHLLDGLAVSLSSEKADCRHLVSKLEQSLAPDHMVNREPLDSLSKSKLRQLPYFGDLLGSSSACTPGKASVSKGAQSSFLKIFSSFGDGDAVSAPTPMKPSVAKPHGVSSFGTGLTVMLEEGPESPVDAETHDDGGSPSAEGADAPRRGSGTKLTLPFFQSFRKGPGLGATPACTPIATASVRKDAKKHVFPSAAPSPMPHANSGFMRPIPVLSLSPEIMEPLASPAPSTLPKLKIAPEIAIEPTHHSESESAAPMTGTDVAKFRKLLSMGAPKEAVRAKMRQAGLDPDLLEEKQGFNDVVSPPKPAVTPIVLETETKADEATASGTADVSKFRKLLSMGAPLEAVKAKMRQAGLDPALLEVKMGFMTPPQSAAESTAAAPEAKAVEQQKSSPVLVKDDPQYAKFFKLQSMGAPAAAVKAKMQQAGLNPDLLDTPDAAMPSAKDESVTPAASAPIIVKEHPDYAKFFKLQSMGAPAAAVKAKMVQAGLNPDLLDTPDAAMPSSNDPQAAESVVLVKDDLEYAKFFKLQSMGAPAAAVKAKMSQAGLNPDLLDTPDAPMPSKNGAVAPEAPAVLVKDDPEYAKFFKLQAMGAPTAAVKAKMVQAGLNPELLDTPDAVLPSKAPSAPAAPVGLVKDDPEYAKFFKLASMGAPAESVKAKMVMAGLRPELLDTPDAPLPAKGDAAPSSVKPAAARRAHLTIAIKPPIKQTTRSFYWQQLRGEVIKGTIWEEIEKESSNQNNQTPLVLSDADLAVLETEFPAPNKDGAATTGRHRTSSMDHLSKEPGSPLASPRVVFLIERSRANNVSIIIKQFRLSHAAIREAIMKLDANVLTLDRVQGLLKIVPTDEEIAAIVGFQGDPLTLNEAERILKELITVPRLKQRLQALQAKLQFPTLVRDLQSKVAKLSSARSEIAESAEFKTILQVVLQVGNKMNHGTNRGDAKGFRLVDLTKLVQLKSSVDKSSTLLHYVARMIRLKKGNLVRLGDALSSLYDVQNIPIPELQSDMNKITEVIDYVSVELSAQKLKNAIEEKEECDFFVKVMHEFLEAATQTTTDIKLELETTLKLLKETMGRFDRDTDASEAEPQTGGGASSVAGANEFFGMIYEFSVALTKADRENELKRIREERKQKQQKPAAPMRSYSSANILSGIPSCSKSALLDGKSEDDVAGPETPEASHTKAKDGSRVPLRAPGFSNSPKTRSASMSSIIDSVSPSNNTPASTASPARNSVLPAVLSALSIPKPGKTPTTAAEAVKSPSKQPSTGKPPQSKSRMAPTASTGKHDEDQPAQKSAGVAKDKPKAKGKASNANKPVMHVPGKIVSTSKSKQQLGRSNGSLNLLASTSFAASLSPVRKPATASVSSVEKAKALLNPRSVEKVVPFDASSLEEVRSQLFKAHATSNEHGHDGARKPEIDAESALRGNNSGPPSPERQSSEVDLTLSLSAVS